MYTKFRRLLELKCLLLAFQYLSGLYKKGYVPNKSSVRLDFCLFLCSVEICFKYVINNYLL